ncbi:carbohydrate ABC transporter permease [Ruania zhangjianzhongii]|uniref:carbohydrate ABC transporter permease n=1 Tax=Ruania zhangjianzhongii TaxID=2603206 RepID=UPI001F1A7DAA|nr:carbohydrate ABC transporter permease [Ruania zhangjianzhongii]
MSTHARTPVRRRRRPMVGGQLPPSPAATVVKAVVFSVACALVILPFVGIISTSMAPPEQVSRAGGLVLFPERLDFSAYDAILSGGIVTRALGVSVIVTVCGTLLSLTVSSLLAYTLTRRALPFRRALTMLVVISLFFSPGLLPTYLAVQSYGLLNSLASLIVPTALSAFNVIVLRAFFGSLPDDILDAAEIDGASEIRILTSIVVPLSKAALAVIGLFYAVGYWNAFFSALLYLNDSTMWPLQLVLRTYVVDDNAITGYDLAAEAIPAQPSLQMAILVVSVVPILLVYPWLQKHFAKGALTGAIKG